MLESRPSRPRLSALLLLAGLWLVGCGKATPVESLVLLAQPGPWPWVSRLVGYDGRVWFASSSLGIQHNSADLYSYDPRTGAVRYERQLFSQAAGRPAVMDGRLYWPHDDSRFHLGLGHISVTDGERWETRVIPGVPIHHLHALDVDAERRLLAAGAYRRPVLAISEDGGLSWLLRVAERREAGGVARITRLALAGDQVFGDFSLRLRRREGRRLVVERDGAWAAVADWPAGREILSLVAFGGRAWAIVDEAGERALWRSDGHDSERVGPGPGCRGLRDLATEGDRLFALCAEPAGGSVWASRDGRRWVRWAELSEGWVHELLVYAGTPFVGGRGPGAIGALWGPAPPSATLGSEVRALGPQERSQGPPGASSWDAAGSALREALRRPASYAGGAADLRDRILELARAGPPPDFFTGLLDTPFPEGSTDWPETEGVARPVAGPWLLLWGTFLAAGSGVPLELLSDPFGAADSERQKYLDATLGAIAALQGGGQRDADTVEALLARFAAGSDPLWLTGDVVGALTAVTGERFGYDRLAWQRWWAEASAGWLP